jgi:hypothetical protein
MVMLSCVVPIGALIVLFSGMGYGPKLHGILADNDIAWIVLFGSGFFLASLLYLLDVTRWKDEPGLNAAKHIMFVYIMISWGTGFVLCATNWPDANLVLCMMGLPSYFYAIKEWKYYHVDLKVYLQLMGCSLLVSGILAVLCWIMWMNGVLFWDTPHTWKDSRVEFAGEMCPLVEDGGGARASHCVAVYLAYFYPLFIGTSTVLFGGVALLLKMALSQKHHSENGTRLEMTVKVALIFFLVGVFGIWVATGIAAAGVTLSNTVSMLAIVLMAELSLFVTGVLGFQHVKAQVMAIPLFKSMASTSESDWLKAVAFITAAPAAVIYLSINFLRQCCFLYLCGVVQKLTGRPVSEAPGVFPNAVNKLMTNVRHWQWSSVLSKMCYLSIFYFVCIIGVGRVTTVFFSWLNEQLSSMDYVPMVLLFIAFGVSLFLLPPVPGVPVYIIGGITVVEAGEDDFGGFVPSCLICIAVCLFIKLSAVAMQQKMIGEQLSNSVTVRALVGVNDIQIRAVRHILMRPGLNIAKVCILCGGPDWPTSVLTGILHLRLSEMLIGTLPIVFLIAPCVITGVSLVKGGREGGMWETLGPIMLGASTISQCISMVSAAYFVEKVAAENQQELAAIPLDMAVFGLNEKKRAAHKKYLAATDWKAMAEQSSQRVLLILAAFTTVTSCYIVQIFPEACFVTFDITDSIDEKLGGNAMNMLKPLGQVAFVLFFSGTLALWLFNKQVAVIISLEFDKHQDQDKPAAAAISKQKVGKAIV